MSVKGDLAKILLTAPACTEIGEKVALSRRIDKHWVCGFAYLRLHPWHSYHLLIYLNSDLLVRIALG